MNRHETADHLWRSGLDLLLNAGNTLESRAGTCDEIIGHGASLPDPTMNVVACPLRRMSPHYAAAEFLWYMSGESTIDRLLPYAPQYQNFADDGIAFGSYGARWNGQMGWVHASPVEHLGLSQLTGVIKCLRDHPESRQAILTMWDSADLHHAIRLDRKDLPCTIALQFLLREDVLHMVTYMRSNDVWLGTPYDVFCFTTLQSIVAVELEAELGTYTHFVGSFHLYERNREKATEVLKPGRAYAGYDTPHYKNPTSLLDINVLLDIEALMRKGKAVPEKLLKAVPERSLAADLLLCIATFWAPTMFSEIGSCTHPGLRLLLERKERDHRRRN